MRAGERRSGRGRQEGPSRSPEGSWPSALQRYALIFGSVALMVQNVALIVWGASILPDCFSSRDGEIASPADTVALDTAATTRMSVVSDKFLSSSTALPTAAPIATPTPTAPPPPPPRTVVGARHSSKRLTHATPLSLLRREKLAVLTPTGSGVAAAGTGPNGYRFCIGLVAPQRERGYPGELLRRLLQNANQDVHTYVVAVLLASFDKTWQDTVLQQLRGLAVAQSGKLHVIRVPEGLYPPMDFCPPNCTMKMSPAQMKRSARRNVDTAVLLYYSAPLADFYLHLEDDFAPARQWLSKIGGHLRTSYPPGWHSSENAPWRMINYGGDRCLGQLYQVEELPRLAQHLLLFYDQAECGESTLRFVGAATQGKPIEYWKKTERLFQRVAGQPEVPARKSQDVQQLRVNCGKTFAQSCEHCGLADCHGDCTLDLKRSACRNRQEQQPRLAAAGIFDNPPALSSSNMVTVPTFGVEYLYSSAMRDPPAPCNFDAYPKLKRLGLAAKHQPCWFWSKAIEAGQYWAVIFSEPQTIFGLSIEFGNSFFPEDVPQSGVVEVAQQPDSSSEAPNQPPALSQCGTFAQVTELTLPQRQLDWVAGSPVHANMTEVKCLRFVVPISQGTWMIVSKLRVKTRA